MEKRSIYNESHRLMVSFIDRDEIEEMLGEYYDFKRITDEQWLALDKEVSQLCSERGVGVDYSEAYVRVCDICCERLHFPTNEV